jgi:hypothetical protein
MNKRSFLKASSVLAAGAFIPANLSSNFSDVLPGTKRSDKMPIIRTLGKTGIQVPIVSSGIIPQQNPGLIKALFESGIKHFDSAWEYQNGINDTMVGDMLRKYGRENFIISTKVLLPADQRTGLYVKEATTQAFMEQLEVTLGRLGIECADIVYLHKPPVRAALLNEDMLNGLVKAKQQGKTRFVGFSSHSNQVDLIDAAMESKIYEVALLGYNFRQDSIVKPAIARASEAGMGIVAMKVFAGEYEDKERNKPIHKAAALKWVLQDENVHTAILTIRTIDDFQTCLPVISDITMTDQEKKDIALAGQSPGLYCLGCERCKAQCTNHLPIPDLMRAYMYTYGYRESVKGKKVIKSLCLPENPCSDCGSCFVRCTQRFDVAEKIRDIIRLNEVPDEFLV